MSTPNTPAENALTGIPPGILAAMGQQMRAVLAVQAARAAECAQAGEDAAAQIDDAGAARFAAMRAEYRAERSYWNEGGPTMVLTVDEVVDTAAGHVPIRIHRPSEAEMLPGIVFLHGGGFTVGDLDTHDRIMRVIAAASGAAVIGVDYSLSPEVKFPHALHQTAGVIDLFARIGERFGIDGTRLAVGGDSAGAMLTLGAALLLRDDPASVDASPLTFEALRALLLFYGGHGLIDSGSRRLYGGAWDGMGADDLGSIVDDYFLNPGDETTPYVDHLRAELAGLPPVFLAAAGLDPLHDDSQALHVLLQRAGVPVEYVDYPGVLHSFLHFGRILDEAGDVLGRSAAFAASRLS
ncbi:MULTISPECIES: alpha/beta hydrolase fold domain-containing protein [unclassified Brevibacterium]|uniref:alpha/beta hydrolase fold domain-containing protein n=1 Tax=unclassified Brevibacterium TaxID=2614124 RepID=UPI001E64CB4D|nr:MULTISPECIES: alpha/beta hydrolase fold domain-containing protein [unclassified Brevibacterium]MDK8434603.1 alpha/beta hydrolase fold domain-containing protein [Brevibacterium sp. H-BE7]